jgi:cell division protein FtsW
MYNAIVALGSGGLLGLGTSNQSYGHLPVPHSDHIFNVIGEIYGFIALTLLSIGFVVILFRGFNIARNSVNPFGYYLALGIVFQIMLNFIVIFGLCIGILIQTGLPLPFLSYGGNALIFYSIEIGVLLNIGVQSQKVSTKPTIVDRFNRVFRTS